MTTPFDQLSRQTQLARLRPIAMQAAQKLGLQPKSLKLVHYGYNATYKLTDYQNRIFSLKLILDTPRTESHLRAELEWCTHLAKQGVPVAQPFSPLLPKADLPGFPKPVYALCNHWLYGRKTNENPSPNTLAKMCRLTRTIYENPPPPSPHKFPEYRQTLGETPCFITDRTILESIAECDQTLSLIWKKQPATPLHFDLHNWNALNLKGTLQAFDFEYAHIAPPLLEVANLIFYFTFAKPKFDPRPVIWSQFDFRPSDFNLSDRQFESLIIARKILFANDMFTSNNPELAEMRNRYLERTKLLVEHFNRTDRYDPAILP